MSDEGANVARTASGKAVHGRSPAGSTAFVVEDHEDASHAHRALARLAPSEDSRRHKWMAGYHAYRADRIKKKEAEPGPPEPDVSKGHDLFVVASLNKGFAGSHKYIKRERKGNRWVYTYFEREPAQSGATKSGKPIYEPQHADAYPGVANALAAGAQQKAVEQHNAAVVSQTHAHFSQREHQEAAWHHIAQGDSLLKQSQEAFKDGDSTAGKALKAQGQMHRSVATAHNANAQLPERGIAAPQPVTPTLVVTPPVVEPPAGPTPPPAPRAKRKSKPLGEPKESPRATVAAEEEAAMPTEYEFARKSAVGNAGEDLKNSARHKRNQWTNLAQAERDGTAGDLVKRDVLMAAMPVDWFGAFKESEPRDTLAAYLTVKKFPGEPADLDKAFSNAPDDAVYMTYFADPNNGRKTYSYGTSGDEFQARTGKVKTGTVTVGEAKKALRAGYVEAFTAVRNAAEASAKQGSSASEAVGSVKKVVSKIIADRRKSNPAGHYDDSINTALVRYHNVTLSSRAKNGSVASDLYDFHKLSANEQPEASVEAAKKVLEGKTVKAAFGVKGEKRDNGDFNAAAAYVDHAERIGPDRPNLATRQQQQDALLDDMGMRGLQWGNSVTDEERLHHLQQASTAFADLADVTGLPTKMASFNGRLGLAIGARGHGNALAHYEPTTRVINLTRKGGVGALAHEWGHFFDNIINELGGGGKSGFLSSGSHYRPQMDGPVGKAMFDVVNSDGWRAFESRMRSSDSYRALPSARKRYWSSNLEMFARSFETHVQQRLKEKGRKNTYLSGIGTEDGGLWPSAEEAKAMGPKFDALFAAFKNSDMLHKALRLCGALSKSKTDGNPSEPDDAEPEYANQLRGKVLAQKVKEEMASSIANAGGEGTRGGHIIGHTKSGKPVYGGNEPHYSGVQKLAQGGGSVKQHGAAAKDAEPSFNKQDHADAALLHHTNAQKEMPMSEKLPHLNASHAHLSASKQMRKSHLDSTEKSMNAQNTLNNYLNKASGEGSHGGHIIGHTKSGKPIYASGHAQSAANPKLSDKLHGTGKTDSSGVVNAGSYKKWHGAMDKQFSSFSRQDHLDAAKVHSEHARETGQGAAGSGGLAGKSPMDAHNAHIEMAAHASTVGKTTSGKEVKGSPHPMYRNDISFRQGTKGFSSKDHHEAAAAHSANGNTKQRVMHEKAASKLESMGKSACDAQDLLKSFLSKADSGTDVSACAELPESECGETKDNSGEGLAFPRTGQKVSQAAASSDPAEQEAPPTPLDGFTGHNENEDAFDGSPDDMHTGELPEVKDVTWNPQDSASFANANKPQVFGKSVRHGIIEFTERGSDARAAAIAKGGDFYSGAAPRFQSPLNGKLCKSCTVPMPHFLTACPSCGDGAVMNKSIAAANVRVYAQQALQAPRAEQAFRPSGIKIG